MRHRWKALAAPLLAISIAVTGCGGRDDNANKNKEPGTDNTGGSSPQAAGFVNPEDCADYKGTQGVSGDTIKLGTIFPESGTYAPYAALTKGMEAYFKAANDAGGLEAGDGKTYKIELVKGSDDYDASKTLAVAKKLVAQDGVFAFVGQIGTEPAKAIRDYMNENCVPNIALATGSTEWGKSKQYPWYIAGLPSYATEAHAWMTYLKEASPKAKIALMYQADDMGEAYKASMEREIKGSEMEIVESESFNVLAGTPVEATVAKLSQTKADVFVVAVGGTSCMQSLKAVPDTWTPSTFISLTCAVPILMKLAGPKAEGVHQAQATYDLVDPADADQPSVKEFKEKGKLGGLTDDDMSNGIAGPGWGFAALFAKALKETKTVDRAAIMNTLYSLKDAQFGMIREGITVNTDGAKDPWAIEGFRIVERKGDGWVEKAPVKNWEGKSNEFGGVTD